MNSEHLQLQSCSVIRTSLNFLLVITLLVTAHSQQPPGSAPDFPSQPRDLIGTVGENASIFVTVTGSPAPTLQWQVSRDNGAKWSDLSNNGTYGGVTLASLSITAMPLTLSGARYRCIASNQSGSEMSNACTLLMAPPTIVTTLAGGGGLGWTDGTGSAASFYNPCQIAVDATGDVFVVDDKLREVSPAGVVTTVAGVGSVNGPGGIESLLGVAVDVSGSVIVANASTSSILEAMPNGVVATLAGSGIAGSTDGTGTAASFNYPAGVSADASGNIYVADSGNCEIRKISGDGDDPGRQWDRWGDGWHRDCGYLQLPGRRVGRCFGESLCSRYKQQCDPKDNPRWRGDNRSRRLRFDGIDR